jgi:hypothetical protein
MRTTAWEPTRREWLQALPAALAAAPVPGPSARAIKALHDSLTAAQKKAICFPWDHPGHGGLPLRLHVSNNWAVSRTTVASLTRPQQALVEEVMRSVLEPGWVEKLARQARDDTGRHWTEDRKVAFFGAPGSGRCQCVLTGFHLTLRAVEAQGPVAFGGAIAHGHQPSGFHEKVGHPGNVFWYQAQKAHDVYRLLNGRQQKLAVVRKGMPWYEFDRRIDRTVILPNSKLARPLEPDVRFRGPRGERPGLPVAEMTADQKAALGAVLAALLGPYRQEYRDGVLACLGKQGGLERCRLIFYEEHTLGKKGEWDNWRLEGPAFVWYFRGAPHVHIWIHVAERPDVAVTSHFG